MHLSPMHLSLTCLTAAAFLLLSAPFCTTFVRRDDSPVISLTLAGKTTPIEADKPAIFYPKLGKGTLFLVGNDGSAIGGIRIFNLSTDTSGTSVIQLAGYATGRTKLVTTIYNVSGKDFIATIDMPDSMLRFFPIEHDGKLKNGKPELGKAIEARTVIGDWSAICTWRSGVTGSQYLYLFGKGKVVMFVVREGPKQKLEIVEVQTFPIPVEAQSCAITPGGAGFFGAADKMLYSFTTADSISPPTILEVMKVEDEVSGLSVYHGGNEEEYMFLAMPEALEIFSLGRAPAVNFTHIGSVTLPPGVDEFKDLALYQQPLPSFPQGFLFYSAAGDDAEFFAVSSLEPILSGVNSIIPNIVYNPRQKATGGSQKCPERNDCSNSGFCLSPTTCSCFAGSAGSDCSKFTCPKECSGHGKCVSANTCSCKKPWGGVDCSTLVIPVQFETETTGGKDSDDPAIWIHPDSAKREASRIIATTKSKEGEGLAVFTPQGKLVQHMSAPEPNNVAVLYGVEISGTKKTLDLAVAGCRGDKTLCMFQVESNGTLSEISGGTQPLPAKFSPYGSCVYHSPKDGSTYAFINSKTSEYLQFRISAALPNSTRQPELSSTLVRRFFAGTGGQVEGCVVDDENSLLLLGEEPLGLWAYPAEPDTNATAGGYLIDDVNGKLDADVEGVALIPGPTRESGYILVSVQGMSAYNIYYRAAPHAFVMRFSLGDSDDGTVDGVTNTDGIAATGIDLGMEEFRYGVVVVHDDVNQKAAGGVDKEVSFKIVGVERILGNKDALGKDRVKRLLADVGTRWDPRAVGENGKRRKREESGGL
ncbi:hypothetical protein BGX38DRAFT_1228206 [Terfezia claveryi]|nr:hypothetical protein BGX38DRAFT_1228206 [Terfezia claveryi]